MYLFDILVQAFLRAKLQVKYVVVVPVELSASLPRCRSNISSRFSSSSSCPSSLTATSAAEPADITLIPSLLVEDLLFVETPREVQSNLKVGYQSKSYGPCKLLLSVRHNIHVFIS